MLKLKNSKKEFEAEWAPCSSVLAQSILASSLFLHEGQGNVLKKGVKGESLSLEPSMRRSVYT